MRMYEVSRIFEIRLDHWRTIVKAEELNMHFSSAFTRGDTSSLPVPEKVQWIRRGKVGAVSRSGWDITQNTERIFRTNKYTTCTRV